MLHNTHSIRWLYWPPFGCVGRLLVQYSKIEIYLLTYKLFIVCIIGGDNSDEFHCQFDCLETEYYCQPKGCLSREKLCNGEIDCFDASDEPSSCDNVTKKIRQGHNDTNGVSLLNKSRQCLQSEFKCLHWSECVPIEVQCDGYVIGILSELIERD